MGLQDQIDAFQKLIFSHFQSGTHNECRISALVPLVQESYGIYKFITSMLRAMHTGGFLRVILYFPTDHSFVIQRLATLMHFRLYMDATMLNITAWSDSTMSVRTCVT